MQYVRDQAQALDWALPHPWGPSTPAEPPENSSAHRPLSLPQATQAVGDAEGPTNWIWASGHRNAHTQTLTSSLLTHLSHPHERCAVGQETEGTLTRSFQWGWTEHGTVLYTDVQILQRKAFTLTNNGTELAFKTVVGKPPKSWATLFLERTF